MIYGVWKREVVLAAIDAGGSFAEVGQLVFKELAHAIDTFNWSDLQWSTYGVFQIDAWDRHVSMHSTDRDRSGRNIWTMRERRPVICEHITEWTPGGQQVLELVSLITDDFDEQCEGCAADDFPYPDEMRMANVILRWIETKQERDRE